MPVLRRAFNTLKRDGGYFAAPIRQIVVPQSGHLPFVMGLPFFVMLSTGSFMIFFALHFTQYASIAMAEKHLSVLYSHEPQSSPSLKSRL